MGVYYIEDADGNFVRLGFFKKKWRAWQAWTDQYPMTERAAHRRRPFKVRSEHRR